MRRSWRVAGILALGAGLEAVLYWGLLNTPDANALMLALSAVLAVLLVVVAGIVVNAAVLAARGEALAGAFAAGARGLAWFVVAALPLVAGWFLIARTDSWIAAHQGEINAWFIARFGWSDISRLFLAEMWISRWLRWALLPLASLSLLTRLLGRDGDRRLWWLKRALHWRALLAVTAVFVLLWVLPWQLTMWRPALPPTWIEPAVAALRLGIVFVLSVAGAAIITLVAAREARDEQFKTTQTPSSKPGL